MTLTNAFVCVMNRDVLCLFNLPTFARFATRCFCAVARADRRSRKEFSDVALLGGAGMPLGVGVVRAAEPLAAALAILLSAFVAGLVYARNPLAGLFLGLNGWSRHRFLLGK